jgi:hypothetical protein
VIEARVLGRRSCGFDHLSLLRISDNSHNARTADAVFLCNVSQRHSGETVSEMASVAGLQRVEPLRGCSQRRRNRCFGCSKWNPFRNCQKRQKAANLCVFGCLQQASKAWDVSKNIFQSAESAIEIGRRLQRHQIAGLKNRGSCSIPTAPGVHEDWICGPPSRVK